MAKIHSMEDYRMAKRMVKDIPQIMKNLDKCEKLLHPYSNYYDVAAVIDSLNMTRFYLALHYDAFKTKFDNKGRV